MKYAAPYGVLDPLAPYVNGDPSIGREGSIPPAAAVEHPMREIVRIIEETGITPSEDDLAQLWKAIQIAPWIQEYCVDTGSANVYSASLDPAPTQMYVGMRVAVLIANANSGTSTLNINGLGAYGIVRATKASLSPNDLKTGMVAHFVFDGAYWQIINFMGFTSDTTITVYQQGIPFAVDAGTANAIIAPFSEAWTSYEAGRCALISVQNDNTGSVTLKANALAPQQLVWPDGTQLEAGDVVDEAIIFVCYDGTKFQLLSIIHPGGGGGSTTNNYGVPGTIDIWPTELVPAGALECNGQSVLRTQYSRLYDIIGTRYGAADATHFNLPDFRGQFVRGWSHSTGIDPDAASRTNRGDGVTGDHVGTRQGDAIKEHAHVVGFNDEGDDIHDERSANYNPMWPVSAGTQIEKYLDLKVPQSRASGGYTKSSDSGQSLFVWASFAGMSGLAADFDDQAQETRPKNISMMIIIWT